MAVQWEMDHMRQYEARLSDRMHMLIRKEFDRSSRGPETWKMVILGTVDFIAVEGLEAAKAMAERIARERLAGALGLLAA